MTAQQQRFDAMLERGDRALGWTIARVPFDPRATWPEMIRFRVCGQVAGPAGTVEFRSSLFPEPGGTGFYLLVSRAMKQGAGIQLGTGARISLQPDLAERPAELPEELDVLLDEAEGLRNWYSALTEYMRREIGKWVVAVKSEDARVRRAEMMAERMLSTMEAEADLPPLIERAFREQPKARIGWHSMSAVQRRNELFAVFLYQSPEARDRRVAKLIETALRHAPKA